MRLSSFSVKNFRSITNAKRILFKDLTVLVGKNNEGKSNFLTALNIAMSAIEYYANRNDIAHGYRYTGIRYNWERDYPVQKKKGKSKEESMFTLVLSLTDDELLEFNKENHVKWNNDLPIVINIGKDNEPKIEITKKGSSTTSKKTLQITQYISERLSFNYIGAVRTEGMSLSVLTDIILNQLNILYKDDEYINCIRKIETLEQQVFDELSAQMIEPLKTFIPDLKSVKIENRPAHKRNFSRMNSINVIIDDGVETSISYKGDGIKSLIALAILKDMKPTTGASIIAIEEPESHLHPGAIHGLVEIIRNISKHNQVLITTHNPLFVQQNDIKSNIIVDSGSVRGAKNIEEIRDILGVQISDNLRNAKYVLVVEGENDKLVLDKLLPVLSSKIGNALNSNKLVIKALHGAGNLLHDLQELKYGMCSYFVLMDNDEEGKAAIKKSIEKGLLMENQYKLVVCTGLRESEFEDCIKESVYKNYIKINYNVDITVTSNGREKKNKEKWSKRMGSIFNSQGTIWSPEIEKNIKMNISNLIPDKIKKLDDIFITARLGFLTTGVVIGVERMLDEMH